jgi:hypothetical protein
MHYNNKYRTFPVWTQTDLIAKDWKEYKYMVI